MAAGRIRTDLSASDVTGLLTVTLMSAAQMSLLDVQLTESPLDADQLWAWCAAAVGADKSATSAALTPARSRTTAAAKGRAKRKPATGSALQPKSSAPTRSGSTPARRPRTAS